MRNTKSRILLILISIAAVNVIGVFLRSNNLDTYFILFGFRFQLSFTLPFLLIFREDTLSKIKIFFTAPDYTKILQPLLWIFLPFIIITAVLYFTKVLSIGDPEYFYEFGLSSIFDLPLYFLWNFPQLLLFALYLLIIQPDVRNNIILTAVIIIFLFAYQFIPLTHEKADYYNITALFLAALSAAVIIKYFSNIYWLCVFIFMVFWTNLLAFGTGSQIMLHIIFAAEYDKWEGFFDITKNFYNLLLPAQWIITLIFIYAGSLVQKNKI